MRVTAEVAEILERDRESSILRVAVKLRLSAIAIHASSARIQAESSKPVCSGGTPLLISMLYASHAMLPRKNSTNCMHMMNRLMTAAMPSKSFENVRDMEVYCLPVNHSSPNSFASDMGAFLSINDEAAKQE